MFRLALFALLPACGLIGTDSTVSVLVEADASCAVEETTLEAGFEADLSPSGCSYLITAANADESTRLLLDSAAFADAALEGSGSAVYTLPDTDLRLEVELGCELNAEYCTDFVEFTPQVTTIYTATAGTVTVTATRDEESYSEETGYEATATVVLEGVVLVDEAGNTVSITSLTWEDVRLYNPMLG